MVLWIPTLYGTFKITARDWENGKSSPISKLSLIFALSLPLRPFCPLIQLFLAVKYELEETSTTLHPANIPSTTHTSSFDPQFLVLQFPQSPLLPLQKQSSNHPALAPTSTPPADFSLPVTHSCFAGTPLLSLPTWPNPTSVFPLQEVARVDSLVKVIWPFH